MPSESLPSAVVCPALMPVRVLQSRLLDESAVVDAVPVHGAVHFIAGKTSPQLDSLAAEGLTPKPVPERLEDAFIDLAFEDGPVPGMTAKEIKKYIRYIADWRLDQLGFDPIYMVDDHPLPWLAPLLNGVEHANFFETRATEYSKAATRGNWNDVWANFDQRRNARAANEPGVPEEGGEPDMFGDVSKGVAAE